MEANGRFVLAKHYSKAEAKGKGRVLYAETKVVEHEAMIGQTARKGHGTAHTSKETTGPRNDASLSERGVVQQRYESKKPRANLHDIITFST